MVLKTLNILLYFTLQVFSTIFILTENEVSLKNNIRSSGNNFLKLTNKIKKQTFR